MGKTRELFTKLREEEFLKEHIIVCTLKPVLDEINNELRKGCDNSP